MLQIEFLDTLYRWKVEAEQELEKLQETNNDPLPTEEADWLIKIRDIKIKNAEGLVNRYKTTIRSYITKFLFFAVAET